MNSSLTLEDWLREADWPADRPVEEARAAWERGEAPVGRLPNPVPLKPPAAEHRKLAKLSGAELARYHTEANDEIAATGHDPEARNLASRRACWALWAAKERGVALDRSPRQPSAAERAATAKKTAPASRVRAGAARQANPRGSDWRHLTQDLATKGWRIEPTQKGHIKLFAPNGKCIVVASGPPSDFRVLTKIKADLRRCGYQEEARAGNPIVLHPNRKEWEGMSRGARLSSFAPGELAKGAAHELEHSKSKLIARRTAADHLVEDPAYYTHLEEMESRQRNPRPSRRGAGPSDATVLRPDAAVSPDDVAALPVGTLLWSDSRAWAVVSGGLAPVSVLSDSPDEWQPDGEPAHSIGESFTVIARGNGRLPTGSTAQRKTMDWWNKRQVARSGNPVSVLHATVSRPDGSELASFDVEVAPLEQEMDLLLRIARTTEHGNIIALEGPGVDKHVRVVKSNGRVGYEPLRKKGQTMHAPRSHRRNEPEESGDELPVQTCRHCGFVGRGHIHSGPTSWHGAPARSDAYEQGREDGEESAREHNPRKAGREPAWHSGGGHWDPERGHVPHDWRRGAPNRPPDEPAWHPGAGHRDPAAGHVSHRQERLSNPRKPGMTMVKARKILTPLGLVIQKTDWDNELRVSFRGATEDEGYYTDDLDDAVHTGVAMAESHASGGGMVMRSGGRVDARARRRNPSAEANRYGDTFRVTELSDAGGGDDGWIVVRKSDAGERAVVARKGTVVYQDKADAEIMARELRKGRTVIDATAVVTAHRVGRAGAKHGKAVAGHLARFGKAAAAAASKHGKTAAAKLKEAHARRAAKKSADLRAYDDDAQLDEHYEPKSKAKSKAKPKSKTKPKTKPKTKSKPKSKKGREGNPTTRKAGTDWNATTLSSGDRALLRTVVGRMSANATEAQVIVTVEKLIGKAHLGTPLARAVLAGALHAHHARRPNPSAPDTAARPSAKLVGGYAKNPIQPWEY